MSLPSRSLLLAAVLALAFVPTPAAEASSSREETRVFPLSADGAVSLHNLAGELVIEGWDRAEISVKSVVRGCLDKIEIVIDADEDSIRIMTERSDGCEADVDYTIRMPHGASIAELFQIRGLLRLTGLTGDVNGTLVNGRVEASDLVGDLDLTVVSQSLDVSLAELGADQSIELKVVSASVDLSVAELGAKQSIKVESTSGPIDLAIPGSADARVRGSIVNGRISSDFEELPVKRRRHGPGMSVDGALGEGNATVDLTATSGSIRIRKN